MATKKAQGTHRRGYSVARVGRVMLQRRVRMSIGRTSVEFSVVVNIIPLSSRYPGQQKRDTQQSTDMGEGGLQSTTMGSMIHV